MYSKLSGAIATGAFFCSITSAGNFVVQPEAKVAVTGIIETGIPGFKLKTQTSVTGHFESKDGQPALTGNILLSEVDGKPVLGEGDVYLWTRTVTPPWLIRKLVPGIDTMSDGPSLLQFSDYPYIHLVWDKAGITRRPDGKFTAKGRIFSKAATLDEEKAKPVTTELEIELHPGPAGKTAITVRTKALSRTALGITGLNPPVIDEIKIEARAELAEAPARPRPPVPTPGKAAGKPVSPPSHAPARARQ